jgi:hypothetical protein
MNAGRVQIAPVAGYFTLLFRSMRGRIRPDDSILSTTKRKK